MPLRAAAEPEARRLTRATELQFLLSLTVAIREALEDGDLPYANVLVAGLETELVSSVAALKADK